MRCRGASLLGLVATAAALSPPNRSARKTLSVRQSTALRGGGLLRAYDSLLKRRPLPTKMASSGAASAGAGDLLAQTIVGNTYDPRRTLVFAAIGVFYFAPLLHLWYKALHKLEKSGVSSGRFTRRQIIVTPTPHEPEHWSDVRERRLLLRYAAFDRWLPGGANAPILETASRAFHRKFWRIMKANWVVWPLPSFVNLALVPLDYRVLFMNCFASCGSVLLSCLRRAGVTVFVVYLPVCSGAVVRDEWARLVAETARRFAMSLAGRTLVVYYGLIPGLSSSLAGCSGLPLGVGGHRATAAAGVAAPKRSKARSPRLSHPRPAMPMRRTASVR